MIDVLASPVAQSLLHSRIPARLGYLDPAGAPRVVPVWFHWDGTHIVLGTFPRSSKLKALRDGSLVAVSIDSETYPYQGLQLRGPVTLTPTAGLVPEYVTAARRYLDPAEADQFLSRLGDRPMVRITLHVQHAHLLDMRA
ncbi:pyridoxamine 5'-phosphate oxidase family protein [Kutzneria sp. CA-103260]|uniref:pyridoxamine 5'-phosphate oxidase family protein n=1 Tax=Kutzneria sp. CA-103260 TaxID=2802641 RepID=UPI001BA672FE|nr:pyridoxamine 5'-phosphate oxidase family protein [Kutzneria sp. CA-103260]QUQ67798.1 Pyridoxamine 5'-phosphate oxidase [Kutzneria sp. CA-103260]